MRVALRDMWLLLAATLSTTSALLLRPALPRVPRSCAWRTSKIRAQGAWTTAIDEASGVTYFYNSQTGVSQWEQPEQACGAQVLWRVAGTSGIHYWCQYNLCNGDVQVLSRFNMLNQALTVSRVQCIVQIHDGTATLTSCGKGPTLWRPRSPPMHGWPRWIALDKGDLVPLSDGDQVSLDVNDPEGAVFTCKEASAVQQDGGYQQGGGYAGQHAQPQLPYPWEQLVDQNGAIYYSNPQTGAASWDPPQAEYPHQGY